MEGVLIFFGRDGGGEHLGGAWVSLGHSTCSMGYHHNIIIFTIIKSNQTMPFHTAGGSFHILLCSAGCLGGRRKVKLFQLISTFIWTIWQASEICHSSTLSQTILRLRKIQAGARAKQGWMERWCLSLALTPA